MPPIADPVVDWDALLEVVYTSVIGGIGVTAIFALAIFGGTRAIDLRRDGNVVAAGIYGALTTLAFAGVVATVVFGIVVMTQK